MAISLKNKGGKEVIYDVTICYASCHPDIAEQKVSNILTILRTAHARVNA